MNPVLAIIAAVAALAGLGLLWWRRSVGREIAVMAETPTTPAGGVAKLAPGTLTEVKGTLREPLTGEFSNKPCAYFKAEIEREETYWERDSQGRSQRRTRTSIVYTNMKYGACLIQDESGRVGIDFDGATVEATEVVNEPTTAPGAGNASGVIGGILSALSSTNSTYRRKESILAPDIPVFVLGEVQQAGLIGKPAQGSKNKLFVISHKSAEERTKALTSTTRWLLTFAILALAIAAGMLVWSVAEGQKKAAVFAPTITQLA